MAFPVRLAGAQGHMGSPAHLFQLTPHAHASTGQLVTKDEVQLLWADAEGAGFGKLGYHVTDSYNEGVNS